MNRRILLSAALAAISVLVLAPAVAQAATCSPTLVDSAGFEWDLNGNNSGAVTDGSNDVYDVMLAMRVRNPGTAGATVRYDTDDDSCGGEEGGREIVFPPRTENTVPLGFGGLEISRKVYVPITGTPFARWLTTFHNPTTEAITSFIEYTINFGHQGENIFGATSSGDQVLNALDTWAVHRSDPDFIDPVDGPAATLFDGAFGAADRFDTVNGNVQRGDGGELGYFGVTVPPGGTTALMLFGAQRNTVAEALGFATANQFGTEELYAGLSAEERGWLRNWPATPGPPPTDGGPGPPPTGGGATVPTCPAGTAAARTGCLNVKKALKRCQKRKTHKKIRKCVKRVRSKLS